jgi:hypothetical protein
MLSDLERELRDARPNLEAVGRPVRARVARALGLSLRGGVAWWLAQGRRRGRAVGAVILVGAGGAALAATLGRNGQTDAAQAQQPVDWGEMTVLARGAAHRRPSVAIDPGGRVITVYLRENTVEARVRPPGGPWGPTELLSTPGEKAEGPQVALASDGQAGVVVYRERRGGRVVKRVLRLPNGDVAGVVNRRVGTTYVVKVRPWTPGGGFGAAQVVSAPAKNEHDLRAPQVGLGVDGRLVIAWARNGLVETRDLVNGALGPVEVLATDQDNILEPTLAVSPAGKMLLAWNSVAPSRDYSAPARVRAAIREGESWGPLRTVSELTVAEGGPSRVEPLAAAINDQGDAVLAWANGPQIVGQGTGRLLTSRRPAGGSFTPPQPAVSAAREFGTPSAAAIGSDRFVVAWASGTTSRVGQNGTRITMDRTLAIEGSVTGAWSAPVTVSDKGVEMFGFGSRTALATDGAGNLLGVWPSTGGLVARAAVPGGTAFGAAETLSPDPGFARSVWLSDLAATRSGYAVFVAMRLGTRQPQVLAFVREPFTPKEAEEGS